MTYDSISERDDLTEEEKEAEREKRKAWRIGWINVDINGKSVEQRLERLEGIVLGQTPPPTP
jgi:hypothetical protein